MRRMGRKAAVPLLILLAVFAVAVGYQICQRVSYGEEQEILRQYTRNGVLIYGAHESAPPLRFVDTDGVYKGVVVDYMNQLSLELGIEIDVVSYPWDKAQEMLRLGETDLCDMFINEERSKYYAFTDPIYNLRVVLAVAENSRYELSDINRMTIATERGDYANSYLIQHYPEARLIYVKDVGEGVELLSKGKVNAVVGDEPVVYYYMNKTTHGFRFRVINTALYEEPVVLALPKEKAELVPVLNRAIKQINHSGGLEKIQQKWFGLSIPLLEDPAPKNLAKWFAAVLFLGLGLIVAGQLNNRSLKRQVKERTAVLERSQNELQLIFDGILEYIVVLNRDKQIVRANHGLMQRLRRSTEEVRGESCKTILREFCGDCTHCILDECMEAGGVVKRDTDYKNEVYEMAAYPLGGIEDGSLVALRNITLDQIKRKQLLQSSKMMAVGQLAAGMAHEMRNPLGIIRTQSYMLRGNESIDDNARKSLNFIEENVKRAGKIIDNIMNFWRSGGDKEETLDVKENIQNIIGLQSEELKKKKIQVEIRCEERLTMRCTPEALKHILLNLISNAADAVKEGGCIVVEARAAAGGAAGVEAKAKAGAETGVEAKAKTGIEARAETGGAEGDWLMLRCADNGCGIAAENMDSLFNPFFTTKPPGKGTGLGMFVVYSEVEKLSGTISVDSKPGEGTAITILIPGKGGKKDEETV